MIRFGCLGAAKIAPMALLAPCAAHPRAEVRVLAARQRSRAEEMASEAGIPTVVDTYEEVVSHPDVDVVYIPLPISHHHRWVLAALEAGKHVLCEKSMTSNAAEARQLADAAADADLVLMEAFHYRYHPLFERAREIYHSGVLGDIHEIQAELRAPVTDPADIRMDFSTGGGATMDLGCYPISWVRHLSAEEPTVTSAKASVGPPNVDIMLKAKMRLPSGVSAIIKGDMRAKTFYRRSDFRATIRVKASGGEMVIINPLVPQHGNEIRVTFGAKTSRETFSRRTTYAYQFDAFVEALESGAQLHTDAEDAVKQMRVIDACYRAAGLPLRGAQPL